MAINNWRYAWYNAAKIDSLLANSNLYDNSKPNTASTVNYDAWKIDNLLSNSNLNNAFSPAETYQLASQWYANQWNTTMANAFWNIANNIWKYSNFANDAVTSADALLNYIRWNESGLQSVAGNLYNSLVSDLQTQRDYVNSMFWPEWKLTQEVNKYYDDLWNYLSTDAGRQAATIAAQWIHSWASLWAIRAQQNEAYNNSFQRYVQAKEQQINAKQQIASNLINFMSTLRKEYWDTTNQYVIELYKRANDMYNSIAQNLASEINSYNKLAIQGSSWGSSSSSNPYVDMVMWVMNTLFPNGVNLTQIQDETQDQPEKKYE